MPDRTPSPDSLQKKAADLNTRISYLEGALMTVTKDTDPDKKRLLAERFSELSYGADRFWIEQLGEKIPEDFEKRIDAARTKLQEMGALPQYDKPQNDKSK